MYRLLFSSSLFIFVSTWNEDDSKSDKSSDSEESYGRSNRGHNTRTVPSRRTGTRRGVQAAVNVPSRRTGTRTRRGASSLIADLKKEKENSEKQDTFEQELLKMDAVLKKAKKCVEEGGNLTIPFLKALIKSKGVDPPVGRKAALILAWTKVEDDVDWKRTAFFSEQNKKELQVLLEDEDSEDEE